MYHVYYLYRVPVEKADHFLRVIAEAGHIYRTLGVAASTTMRVTEAAAKHGCLGLSSVVQVRSDERLLLGVDSFRDAEQFRSLASVLDDDPRLRELFAEVQEIIDLGEVVRWEVEDVLSAPTG